MELIIFPTFLIAAFIISNALLPKIIGIVKHKNLMEPTNKRSSHQEIVPTLGGIVFFVTLMLGFYFTRFSDEFHFSELIIPGLVILFLITRFIMNYSTLVLLTHYDCGLLNFIIDYSFFVDYSLLFLITPYYCGLLNFILDYSL